MNIAKNMEAIFLTAIALASVTTFATASTPEPRAVSPAFIQADTGMTVVTITGKRLSAAEKAALDD